MTLWCCTLRTAYVHIGSNTSKLLPIWKASTALFPSIYISSPETAKVVVESTIALSIKMAEQAAAPDKRRIPVYPFGWECCECSLASHIVLPCHVDNSYSVCILSLITRLSALRFRGCTLRTWVTPNRRS